MAPDRQGEVAIVDTEDKTLAFGELFVITLSEDTPHRSLAIVQLLREVPCGSDNELKGLMYAFHAKENPRLVFEGKTFATSMDRCEPKAGRRSASVASSA